jgi:transcriptional regulator with XRE-family HTH domain
MKKLKRLKCRLQACRLATGQTQAQAAARAGVSASYWADCERVERCPSAGFAGRMASAVGKITSEVWPNICQVWGSRGGFR